jgi:hypothetical protein
MIVVARTRSRFGGRLDCGHQAQQGQIIYKVDVGLRGQQTTGKNGQGEWWCAECAVPADQPA